MFAKLYGSDDDQILVLKKEVWENDKNAGEVRVYVQPEGLGVCSLACGFSDTDEGWERRERFFNNFNEDLAQAFAERIKAEALNITGDTDD